jgi:uncharacterized circularly permuted ATP-grasp superfamily protein
MWLLDNRVQSPSGSGYALENRIVMANVFPQLNKNIHRKLSPYFTELQKTVGKLGSSVENRFFYRQEQAMKPILSMFIFLP